MNMSMIKLSNQADSSGKSLMISHYHPLYTLSTKMQARDEMDNEERNIIAKQSGDRVQKGPNYC